MRAAFLSAWGRSFCVGKDLAEHVDGLRGDPRPAIHTVREHYNPVAQALHDIEVPIIAVINGACLGAGLGLALASDICIARRKRRGQHRFCQVSGWPLILRCRHPWRRWSAPAGPPSGSCSATPSTRPQLKARAAQSCRHR
ncbi:enoyl-CoA hydratase-related protein [Mycobacterium sp.]|uniref:enoyl-CoA hydratase-related protein n=1 Tax=Mycobacterium sp. TaxID=1785 RepID=UPI002CAF8E69|nr:enoyl-CoA hydratase-related protein [Mycobacterium sp.]HKP42203.1 enoyl-CoA hydratase-related protein [Mycobacterium sp.]